MCSRSAASCSSAGGGHSASGNGAIVALVPASSVSPMASWRCWARCLAARSFCCCSRSAFAARMRSASASCSLRTRSSSAACCSAATVAACMARSFSRAAAFASPASPMRSPNSSCVSSRAFSSTPRFSISSAVLPVAYTGMNEISLMATSILRRASASARSLAAFSSALRFSSALMAASSGVSILRISALMRFASASNRRSRSSSGAFASTRLFSTLVRKVTHSARNERATLSPAVVVTS
ncbi:hypothetical protein D3C87_1498320 [compost metagenome]